MVAVELGLSYRDDGGRGLVVVSFDPGVTTGWAVHRLDLDSLVGRGFVETIYDDTSGFALGEIRGDGSDESEMDMAEAMVGLVRSAYVLGDYAGGDLFAIVMEDFVLRRSEASRSLLAPVRVFSRFEMALRGVTSGAGVVLPYFKQSAADAKNVVTDERLRRWNVYEESVGAVHARDAQRHGILFARKVASVNPLQRALIRAARSSVAARESA